VKTPAPAIALLLAAIGLTSSAPAASITTLYSATDLGAGYTLESNSGGQDYGVANSDGSVVYAFDKSPVTTIDDRIDGGAHAYSYTEFTMQNGQYRAGYNFDYGGGLTFGIYYPTFEAWSNGWYLPQGSSPVSDINSHGQVVGMSQIYGTSEYYAAFSDVNGQSHGFGAETVDNLNNYIQTIPGVTLTSAVKIDDLGRIIAVGSNGDDYLLTPLALGPPATAPEPTALALLAVGSAGLAIRRRFRR
jgi:PEP-CTERM motif